MPNLQSENEFRKRFQDSCDRHPIESSIMVQAKEIQWYVNEAPN